MNNMGVCEKFGDESLFTRLHECEHPSRSHHSHKIC